MIFLTRRGILRAARMYYYLDNLHAASEKFWMMNTSGYEVYNFVSRVVSMYE